MENEWPFDTSTLEKGSEITREMIEKITPHPAGSDGYRLALLGLKGLLAKRLEDRLGVITIRQSGHGLRILTDEEAAVFNPACVHSYADRAATAFDRLLAVDVNKLSDGVRDLYDREVIATGRIIQAIHRATGNKRDSLIDRPEIPKMFTTPDEDE